MAMDKLDIQVVLEHYGMDLHRLKSSGTTDHLRCPFHGADRNPSASVDLDEQRFKCFACDVSGDGWDIVMRQEGIEDWADAFEFARRNLGYEGSAIRGVATEEAFDICAYLDENS